MDTENIHIIDEAYGFKSGCYLADARRNHLLGFRLPLVPNRIF